ncbi:MAG: cytochrome P450 [Tepidisphaeraceae bacterium]|jgi:cytochrome P450
MWQRFPLRMRRALVSALDEAARHGREAADAEDLLAVIADDRESAGAYLLEQCGVDIGRILDRAQPGIGPLPAQRADRLNRSAIRILRSASAEATRLRHDHVGTEHVIAALALAGDLEVGKKLNDAGMTPANAEAAIRRWIADGMPRRRGGWGWAPVQPRLLTAAMRPLQKAARLPRILWNVFANKSLAHPRFVTDPYPLYRWLRERQPVRKDPLAPVWVLTRHDDVMEMLRSPRFRKDPFAPQRLPRLVRKQLGVPGEETRPQPETVSMLFLDPPAHTRVRGVFSRAFTPASLAELRPSIERMARQRIDRVVEGFASTAATGQMDIIADLAYPLPVVTIVEMLGFPAEDFPRIKQWSDDLAAALSLNPSPKQQTRSNQAWNEIRGYFEQVVARMQRTPGNSLLSRLLEAENEPDGLNRDEMFTNCVLLLSAGHETTTNLIGNGMLALLRNRDQWDLLVRQPDLIESAVDELLRYDSPVQWTSRLTGEPIEINGQTIPPGEIVLGCLGAANRDPARFPDPDRLDIRRSDNRHLAFGSGIHYCLGAALAKMEAQIAIRELAARFPRMTLAKTKLRWMKGLTFRGVKSLPVLLR